MSAIPVETDHGDLSDELEAAAVELYRCELALHDAHQSHVDAWVDAASDHLHAALLRHYRAEAALTSDGDGAA